MTPDQIKPIIAVVNLVLGIIGGLRLGISLVRSTTFLPADQPPPKPANEAPAVASRWTLPSLIAHGGWFVLYYPLLQLWWFNPALAGPRLLPAELWIQLAGIALVLLGVGLIAWAYAIFGSWRLDARIESDHRLMSSGLYSVVRHPIYLGLNLYLLGWFLVLPHVVFLIHLVVEIALSQWRLRVEESVLERAFGDDYRDYASRVARQIPGVY